jgi:diguanylate cyclase (GGDEF)-like protein
MIFRIGGDEFLIILETEGQKNTMALRKRLEKNLKEINLNCSNRKISIAFSYGIVTGSAGKIEKLIEKSDTTMYSFKK